MGHDVDDAASFSSEPQEWQREHLEIRKVAARFPKRFADELESELTATLVDLKRKRPSGIRDWNAYLRTALRHRALTLVDKWRVQERREENLDHYTETPDLLAALEGADPGRFENRSALSKLRRKLDAGSYGLLLLWAALNRNQSLVAWMIGLHRNTIRYRLQKIWRTLRECPIENVSGQSAPIQRRSRAVVQLAAEQWEQLADLAQDPRARRALRARLILALATGQSYTEIERRLNTTAPTISRWKRRFEKHGMAGLKTRYRGRRSNMNAPRFSAKWRRAVRRMRLLKRPVSCRKIAQEFGISKSTAHRFLKADRA